MKHEDFREKNSHGTAMFPFAAYKWYGEFEYYVNMHWHKEIEIIFFEKGSFMFSRDSVDYVVEGPAMAFIDPGTLHSVMLRKGQRESALLFDCKMLSYEWYDESQSIFMEPLIQQKLKLPTMLTPEDEIWPEVLAAYKKVLAESDKENAMSKLRIKLYLTELLSLLYENNYLTPVAKVEAPVSEQLENTKKVVSYVKEHYNKRITVSEVADHVGMSEQYFCRYFKKNMGKTLTEYINEIRVNKAAVMLSNTDEKVIDIAIQCGYDNISYFIKRFKVVKGITPQEYRKEARQKQKETK